MTATTPKRPPADGNRLNNSKDRDLIANMLAPAGTTSARHISHVGGDPCLSCGESRIEGPGLGAPISVQALAGCSCNCSDVGKVNWNMAPVGAFVSAHNRAPWASMIERQMDSPMPVPLGFVV
ncbi:hypothetical protein MesoLj131a_29780 [Mesorhizobium sp. 131-2-1]|nr:hypothetical protein MesoLj131a_29780 [Mesorhizobium sp. 131-2-1]